MSLPLATKGRGINSGISYITSGIIYISGIAEGIVARYIFYSRIIEELLSEFREFDFENISSAPPLFFKEKITSLLSEVRTLNFDDLNKDREFSSKVFRLLMYDKKLSKLLKIGKRTYNFSSKIRNRIFKS